jgi:hypothetical protein
MPKANVLRRFSSFTGVAMDAYRETHIDTGSSHARPHHCGAARERSGIELMRPAEARVAETA